jgi:uncharacterized protein
MIVRELSQDACGEMLASHRVARLACARENQPYVIPVHYAYSEGCAYAFTMPGKKLEILRANPRTALLVEESGKDHHWRSVLAEGQFEELPDRIGCKRERDHAWTLLSEHASWWEPGALKPDRQPLVRQSSHVFFRIWIERMSGREAIDE